MRGAPTRAQSVFRLKGLPHAASLSGNEFDLHLYGKCSGGATNHVQMLDDFVAATGTLSYRGRFGTPGLQLLLDDARAHSVDWSAMEGAYCLMVHVGGQLTLVTDPTGLYTVYADGGRTVLSSSFLAVAQESRASTPSTQEIYEYVLSGALYGPQTPLVEVERLDSLREWIVSPGFASRPRPWLPALSTAETPLEELVDLLSDKLLRYSRAMRDSYGDSVCTALSGGYDTRLILALLRSAGVSPYLYVYGRASDPDVAVAKQVARAAGLALDHIDRSAFPDIAPEDLATQVERDYAFLDGIGHEHGVFDTDGDLVTRRDRAARAHLQLNGAGGGAFRNDFWQLPPWGRRVDSFVRTHLDTGDHAACGPAFDRPTYRDRLTVKVENALRLVDEPHERARLDLRIPLIRLRYWTAKNSMLNNQLTSALMPLAEAQYSFPSATSAERLRNYGLLEAAVITQVDADLARMPSAYGHDFFSAVPWRRRLRDDVRRLAPATVLNRARRQRARRASQEGARPYLTDPASLQAVFGSDRLMIDEWFDLNATQDPQVQARALTIELLLRGYLPRP